MNKKILEKNIRKIIEKNADLRRYCRDRICGNSVTRKFYKNYIRENG